MAITKNRMCTIRRYNFKNPNRWDSLTDRKGQSPWNAVYNWMHVIVKSPQKLIQTLNSACP